MMMMIMKEGEPRGADFGGDASSGVAHRSRGRMDHATLQELQSLRQLAQSGVISAATAERMQEAVLTRRDDSERQSLGLPVAAPQRVQTNVLRDLPGHVTSLGLGLGGGGGYAAPPPVPPAASRALLPVTAPLALPAGPSPAQLAAERQMAALVASQQQMQQQIQQQMQQQMAEAQQALAAAADAAPTRKSAPVPAPASAVAPAAAAAPPTKSHNSSSDEKAGQLQLQKKKSEKETTDKDSKAKDSAGVHEVTRLAVENERLAYELVLHRVLDLRRDGHPVDRRQALHSRRDVGRHPVPG